MNEKYPFYLKQSDSVLFDHDMSTSNQAWKYKNTKSWNTLRWTDKLKRTDKEGIWR